MISNRTSARKQLEQQQQAIRLKLEHLDASAGEGASPVSDVVERARVQQAQIKVEQARRAIAQFKAHSPWTDHAWATLSKLWIKKEILKGIGVFPAVSVEVSTIDGQNTPMPQMFC